MEIKKNKQKRFFKNNNQVQKTKRVKFKSYDEYKKYKEIKLENEKRAKLPKMVNYLYSNKKLKKGVFLKKPSFNEIKFPFKLNLKLVNEYIKKK